MKLEKLIKSAQVLLIVSFLFGLSLFLSSTVLAADDIIGNEVTNTSDASLFLSGTGLATDPFKLKINLANPNLWTANQTVSKAFSGNAGPTFATWETTAGVGTLLESLNTTGVVGTWTNHPLNIMTNSLSRMYFDTAGNVGIGITSPGAKLDVISSRSDSQTDIVTINNEQTLTGTPTTARGIFTYLQSNGSSGTIPNFEGTFSFLDVTNAQSISTAKNFNSYGGLTSTGNVTNWIHYGATQINDTGAGSITNQYGLKIDDMTSAVNNWSVYTGNAKSYFGGYVGIGTTNPTFPLSVVKADGAGKLYIPIENKDNTFSASHTGVQVATGGPSGGDPLFWMTISGATSWSMGIDNSDDDKLKFGNSPTVGVNTALTIDTSGKVAIGSSMALTQQLNVVGNIKTTGCLYYNGGSIGTCASDQSLKENVKPLTSSLERLVRLNPVTFNYKDDQYGSPTDTQYGLIAQEVETVFPELVFTGEDSLKGVRYGSSIEMHLINAVKEQQKEIEELKQQIEEIKKKLAN